MVYNKYNNHCKCLDVDAIEIESLQVHLLYIKMKIIHSKNCHKALHVYPKNLFACTNRRKH